MKSHPIFVSTKEIFGVKIPKKKTLSETLVVFSHCTTVIIFVIQYLKKN